MSVESQHIAAIRPVSDQIKEHVAPGTKALVYVGAHKFGITESLEQAEEMVENCQN